MPIRHPWSVPLFVLAAALVMMVAERRWPGRAWPKVAGWWPRALALNAAQAGAVLLAGVLWEPWLQAHRPWSAASLGPALGITLGYLVHTFVYYWWHRARHRVPALWRWVHQVHHSPERIELITSFYKHPIEILANGVLSSIVLYIGVGLDPATASATMLVNGLAELVYHWNVRTPRWLGYIVQRPESHLVHHQYGLHHYNYADLPIFDMLFGTFRNPERWDACCGLGPEQEQRWVEMLAGKDIGSVQVKRHP